MLSRLELKNFKQHESLVVDFATGLTLVTGSNYSGKSNFMKGVAFALGGVSMIPGTAEAVPRRGTKKKDCRVKLDLNIDDATWQIDRGLSSVKLRKNGEVIATGNAAVNEKIEELLGVDRKTFNLIKYVKQGDTQALLTLGSGKLHALLEALSGAKVVNTVITRASDRVKHLAGVLDGIGSAPENYDQIVQWKEEHGKKLTEWHQQIGTMEVQLKEAGKTLAQKRADHAALSEFNNKNLALAQQRERYDATKTQVEGQLSSLRAQISELERDFPDIDAIKAELDQIQTDHEEYSRFKTAAQRASRELQRLDEEQRGLGSGRVEIMGRLRDNEVEDFELQQAEEVLETATMDMGQAQGRVIALNRSIEESVCPTCKRPFEDHNPEELAKELGQAEEDFSGASKLHQFANDRAKGLRAKRAAYNQAKLQAEALERHEGEISASRQAFLADEEAANKGAATVLGRLGEDYGARANALDAQYREAVGRAAQSHSLHTQAEQVERQIAELVEPPAAEPLRTDEARILLKEVSQLDNEYQQMAQHVKSWQDHYTAEYAKWNSWKGVIEAEEKRKAAVVENEKAKEVAASLVKFLRTNRDRFMSELWDGVTGMASEFAEVCTGGSIRAIRRTDDGAFTFYEGADEVPVVEASGAQRSIMSTGLLVALNRLVPGSFGALMLDEPGADMDDAHSAALTQALAASGTQLVMISHRNLEGSLAGSHVHLGAH